MSTIVFFMLILIVVNLSYGVIGNKLKIDNNQQLCLLKFISQFPLDIVDMTVNNHYNDALYSTTSFQIADNKIFNDLSTWFINSNIPIIDRYKESIAIDYMTVSKSDNEIISYVIPQPCRLNQVAWILNNIQVGEVADKPQTMKSQTLSDCSEIKSVDIQSAIWALIQPEGKCDNPDNLCGKQGIQQYVNKCNVAYIYNKALTNIPDGSIYQVPDTSCSGDANQPIIPIVIFPINNQLTIQDNQVVIIASKLDNWDFRCSCSDTNSIDKHIASMNSFESDSYNNEPLQQSNIFNEFVNFYLSGSNTTSTSVPTVTPTRLPTKSPTVNPTKSPTVNPTVIPSFVPTTVPSLSPTTSPSNQPTKTPTSSPSVSPTSSPTNQPNTPVPSVTPSISPTFLPTLLQSFSPTNLPTLNPTDTPTFTPTTLPTASPSILPTVLPSLLPSHEPTLFPTSNPTHEPSLQPTLYPTTSPSYKPSTQPTLFPSTNPSFEPTSPPSLSPTTNPTQSPTVSPSLYPTPIPTAIPTTNPTHHKNKTNAKLIMSIVIPIGVVILIIIAVITFISLRDRKKSKDQEFPSSTSIELNSQNNFTKL